MIVVMMVYRSEKYVYGEEELINQKAKVNSLYKRNENFSITLEKGSRRIMDSIRNYN